MIVAPGISLLNRYLVSLSAFEEPGKAITNAEEPYAVTKFLVSAPEQIKELPGVFNEGFLFHLLMTVLPVSAGY